MKVEGARGCVQVRGQRWGFLLTGGGAGFRSALVAGIYSLQDNISIS